MSKITLNNVGSLIDATTAQTTINSNNAIIQTAFDNTLSRDGTTPNSMSTSLDMNSNQIINLPYPASINSPARLVDVVTNPTITIPVQGTSGHVVPFLDGNNTWSGTNTFTATTTLPAMAANTVKGSIAGGTPADLTKTQLTTLVNAFTSGLSGAVPASGGGTANFLRADGTFAAPTFTSGNFTNSLGADVLLNSTGSYFDGPSIAQGSTGTWWVSGNVTLLDTAGATNFSVKLWDGTTIIDSAYVTGSGANVGIVVSLSGYIASPVGNLKISCKDNALTTGKILFNTSGNSKDSTISAFRIA